MLTIADVDADFEVIRERVAPEGAFRGAPSLTREQNLIRARALADREPADTQTSER